MDNSLVTMFPPSPAGCSPVLFWARLVWLKWLYLCSIWTAAFFCRAGYGNVSGDLINTWRLCKLLLYVLITASLHPIGISKQFFMYLNSLEYVLGQIRDSQAELWLQHQRSYYLNQEKGSFRPSWALACRQKTALNFTQLCPRK